MGREDRARRTAQGQNHGHPGLANQQVAILPRYLPRERALKIVGETWKKRLRSRGVEVLGEVGFSFSRLREKAAPYGVEGHPPFVIRSDSVCRLNPEMARMVVARVST